MSNNRPKLELQLNQPIKLKLLRNEPLEDDDAKVNLGGNCDPGVH
jgi:hypothetical protein